MFLRASKFIFIIFIICFIGISVARPKGDEGGEMPPETDKDSPKGKELDKNKEEEKELKKIKDELVGKKDEENLFSEMAEKALATEKAMLEDLQDELIEKMEEKLTSEMPPVVSPINEAENGEEEEETDKESPSVEKPSETEEKQATPETEKEESKETPEESPVTPSAATKVTTEATIEKQEAPKDTFAVWSDKKKICLLAKFHAVFSIVYLSKRGEEKAEVTIPKTANSKGKCGPNTKFPVLQLSWGKNVFKMVFNKTDEENWALTSMELTYDTSEPLFDGAVNAGKKTARSKDITLFETPLKNSYFCPGQEVVLLYANKKQSVTVRIRELQLQPFEIENGEFSEIRRCSKVVIDEETPYVQDETVPFAVGCTLALITLIILVGFSIHRAYHAAKVDYNSME